MTTRDARYRKRSTMPTPSNKALSRILVVDDDRDMRTSLAELLGEEGYTVEACHTGADALATVEKSHPDLLITDLVMKGMQGLELLRTAKQRDPHLAVVVITAFGTIETAV